MDTADLELEKKKLEQAQKEQTEEVEVKQKNSNNTRNRHKKKKSVSEPPVEDKTEETAPADEGPDLTVMPGILEFSGYCLCPGTVVLGPWVSYKEYVNIFNEPK